MAAPFTFTRESRIRIDAEGDVWHEGERIENPRLAQGLASWIQWDPGASRWILKNPLDWCYVTVDDTPLVVRSARVLDAEGALQVDLSDGSRERVSFADLRVDPEGAVFAYVRGTTLLARFSRAAAFALLDRVDADHGALGIALPGGRIALTTLVPGEVPPYVFAPSARPVPPSA